MSELVKCPCCDGDLRLTGRRLEIVRLTKPTEPWVAKGSRLAAQQAIEQVCAANEVTLPELWPQNHDPSLAAVRRRAAQAAREGGAAASTIGSILRRNESTINKLAPKGCG